MTLSLLTILALKLILATSYASSNQTLLACLGQEEWRLHQAKEVSPEYRLNQVLINELAALQEIQLRPRYHQSICRVEGAGPSVNLIRALLVYGQRIFDTDNTEDINESFREMRISNLRTLEQEAPHILFRYLAEKQALIRYPHCLREKMPELHEYMERYLHLEEEIEFVQLIENKDNFRKIFNYLEDFELIKRQCDTIQEQLDAQRNLNTRR